MKHSVWVFSALGLVTFAVSAFPEDSTRTQRKDESETTPTGSTHRTQSKTESRRGSETTTDEKTVEVQFHDRSNGMTDTETKTTTQHKVQSKTANKGSPDTTSDEKTVKSESKKRADGITETETTTTTKHNAPHKKEQQSTTRERTLENSKGKVLRAGVTVRPGS